MSAEKPQSAATMPVPAATQHYLEVALYLLVLTGFGTLAATGGLDIPSVAWVSAALLLRGYSLLRQRMLLIPERWTTALTVAYVAFYVADYFLISATFLTATVHLVLFVMVVRLFSAQRERDYYFLSVIAFLMVLSAAVLTVDGTFLLTFAGFMLAATATFVLMESRHASAKATVHSKNSSDPQVNRRMAVSLAKVTPALVLGILLGTAAIFFLLPRISTGYLSAYAPGGELTTGFSDRVQLGRIGEIQQSSAVVMHIRIDGDQRGGFDLKWRGVTLSRFDGKTWSDPREQRPVPQSSEGRFELWESHRAEAPLPAGKTIHYQVLMEPMGANVFFVAPITLSLQGNYRLVGMDKGGSVFDLDAEHPVNRYEATSRIAEERIDELRASDGPYPLDVQVNYLKLPPLDPRIAPLAEQITASAKNNYDKAAALESYLRTHYAYTLQLSRLPPRDPLAAFLFERRQGHCEYFASSMAVMLRTLRIPVRVVNGFRTGEFNDLTSQYVVRASNAHSWVEAYFPGPGWVSFDPTPAAAVPSRTGWSRAALYVDAVASFWREWVVNYDLSHQQSLGSSARDRSQQWFRKLRRGWLQHYRALLMAARRMQQAVAGSPLRWSLWGTLITALLALLANVARLWRAVQRARLAARPEKAPGQAATIWYERMTRRLAARGWRKSPAQTAEEFVKCIDDAVMREEMARFTRHYESARFGDSAEDAQRLPELYQEISAVSRR